MNRTLRDADLSGTALEEVRGQLGSLLQGFGLAAQAQAIGDSFQAVFRESLAFPAGTGPTAPSRLSEDGGPIQFATALGTARPSLRFVGDVGPVGGTGAERHEAAHRAMRELAGIIGAGRELDEVAALLDTFAPETAGALRRDPAGAFWLGAAFAQGAAPRLRLYLNGSWGDAAQCRDRIVAFADRFRLGPLWARVHEQLPDALTPLGLALTLAPGETPVGAIYLRAFGLRMADYARIADVAAGPSAAQAITQFGAALLGDEAAYPTPASVLSFGLGSLDRTAPDAELSAELEVCGHCLFQDDAEARARLLSAFATLDLDPGPYLTLAAALASSPHRPRPPRVHSFIGVGTKEAAPSFTVYMKPDLRG